MLEFVDACLQSDPEKRLSAQQLLALPYFGKMIEVLPTLADTNPEAYAPGEVRREEDGGGGKARGGGEGRA